MAKIVFIDVDGTLMDTSGGEIYIPQENIDTIQEAVKRGIHICISSGRMTNSALLICKKVGIEKEYLISYNGAVISQGEEIIQRVPLSSESLSRINAILKKNDIYAHYYKGNDFYLKEKNYYTETYEKKISVKGKIVGDALYELQDVTKILVIVKEDEMEKKAEVMKEVAAIGHLEVTESTKTFIEITQQGANKGSAVKYLCDKLGIPLSQAMAIGDAKNDLAMLDVVGIPVVMENGDDEIKKGRNVTDSVRNAGVAKAIKTFCLK